MRPRRTRRARISTAARYVRSFSPPRVLGTDAATEGYYPFDDVTALGADASDRGRGLVVSELTSASDDCHGVAPSAARCGSEARSPFEACDDGNNADGDGCSAACTLELPCDGDVGPDGQNTSSQRTSAPGRARETTAAPGEGSSCGSTTRGRTPGSPSSVALRGARGSG